MRKTLSDQRGGRGLRVKPIRSADSHALSSHAHFRACSQETMGSRTSFIVVIAYIRSRGRARQSSNR